MRVLVKIVLLGSLLSLFACLAWFSQAQTKTRPAAVPATDQDLPLFLNSTAVGSIANTAPLVTRLRSIFKARGAKGVFTNDVLFWADEQLGMRRFAEIAQSISDAGGQLLVPGDPTCGKSPDAPVMPAPLTLVLSNTRLGLDEAQSVSAGYDCAIPAFVSLLSDERSLKYERVIMTTLEIRADGSFVLDEQMPNYGVNTARSNSNFGGGRVLDDVSVKQRPVDNSALSKAIDSWIDTRLLEQKTNDRNLGRVSVDADPTLQLSIIVSRKLAFSALVPVLREIRATRPRTENGKVANRPGQRSDLAAPSVELNIGVNTIEPR